MSSVPPLHTHTAAPGVRWHWDDVRIAGTGVAIPTVELPTSAVEARLAPLYRRLGFKPGWVEAVTGISSRRMWQPGSYLAGGVEAARAAMTQAGVTAEEIGVVVSCSVYRHRLEPSLACELQADLGIGGQAMNYDVSNACLGFLTGMVQVANMIALGQIESGLIIATEDAAPVLDATIATLIGASADIHAFKDNLATLTLGSGAAACVLSSGRRSPGGHKLIGGTTRSATQLHTLCHGDAGGMATDSVRLLREGVNLATHTWRDFRETLGWHQEGVGVAAMHQVGKAHHETVLSALGVPDRRAPRIFPWLGNVGSVGVPITAFLAAQQGSLRPGDQLALLGIGSGLNCTMLGVTW